VNITPHLATEKDVESIVRICADGWRATYVALLSQSAIEDVVSKYYTPTRVAAEIEPDSPGWLGWIIASDESGVVGAVGAGGLTAENTGEVFVLYADAKLRYHGFGTAVLQYVTAQQEELGATEQWVSVAKGNELGLLFTGHEGSCT
jgi:GNAT superfamily N-acetyltransferase